MKILELFGGIGACTKALEKIGIDFEIADYVEIDKYAVSSFNAMHGTNFQPQDVCGWNKDIEVDLVMHGSPCQDFSLVGLQAGGDEYSGTRSSLMYETIRIVKKIKPKYVIWENVRNLLSNKHIHNFNSYLAAMNELGYQSYYQVLNAKDYGIPQNRERVFTISIRKDIPINFCFPQKQELKLKLQDFIEDEVDEKYYLSEKMIKYISAVGTLNFRNPDCKINLDIARPMTTAQNKRAGTTNYLCDSVENNYDLCNGLPKSAKVRRLIPLETWLLMGFDKNDFLKAQSTGLSDTQLYKQSGNSIVVNVLEAILRELLLNEKVKGTKVQTTIFDFIGE